MQIKGDSRVIQSVRRTRARRESAATSDDKEAIPHMKFGREGTAAVLARQAQRYAESSAPSAS
jgi:hypothetical protein